MYQDEKKGFALLLLFFSPIIGLVYALRKLNSKAKLLFFTLFGAIYGFTINYLEGNDAWSYAQNLKSYYNIDFADYINGFFKILTFNPPPNAPTDLYIYILNGIAGGVFQSPIVLFTIVGTVYGFLYGNALLKIIKIPEGQKITFLVFVLITLFVTYKGLEHMQTIRSWTGMYFLFNGVLGYYQTKRRKYLLMIIFSFFFHLMYLFIALPALIIIMFKSTPRKILIGVYVASFLLNINILSVVNLASNHALSKNKLQSYYRVTPEGEEIDPVANRKVDSNQSWYAEFGKTTVVHWGTNYFIMFLILTGFYRKEIMTNLEFGLLSIGMLIAALANFLSFSHTLYGRTMNNASLYVLAVMVLLAIRGIFNYKNKLSWKNMAVWLGVLIFIPKVVYFASDFLYRTSMSIMAFPFIRFFGEGYNFSIRDFIDQFL